MTQKEEGGENQLIRRGFKLYRENPSLANNLPMRIQPSKPTRAGEAYMISPNTGEVLAKGAFGFIEEREVDSEEFIKVYLSGIKRHAELSKAGALMFEFVYHKMSGVSGKDKDTVMVNFLIAEDWANGLNKRTYQRGLSELLQKEFLYRTMAADVYFVNVRFMFNGDRMALVQSYRKKKSNANAKPVKLLGQKS